jgi:hypothetical protein
MNTLMEDAAANVFPLFAIESGSTEFRYQKKMRKSTSIMIKK